LSEKPAGDRSEYTLGRHASNLHSLLDLKGLFPPGAKSAPHIHFVSHDMGDSVLTEFVAQAHESRGLPSRPFASLTFTNGGMEYSLINQRLGQKLLTSRFGPYFVSLVPQFVRRLFSVAQLKSIWGADKSSMSKDVADIVALNDVSGGLDIMHMLCQYLNERPVQEKRWFENLRKTVLCEDGHKPCAADPSKRSAKDRKQTPVHFVWGNRDAVSPMSIPNFVIEKRLNSGGTLVEVEGAGHFWMLEKPGRWVEEITRVISKEIRVAV
jgi:pimeloyl-ACP methyl ester carboxylesterase